MATGGERNAACKFTNTNVPQRIGAMLKCLSSGRKMGTKITMISVHSSGQPSMKMIACDRIMNCTGVMFRDKTQCSTKLCPPRIAKTPENSAEPTNSQQTMAVVFAVRNTASFVRFQSSVRACMASRKAPAAPTPADSVAVVMPNKITARTTTVRMPSGITDEYLETVGIHPPVVAHDHQRPGEGAQAQPEI